LFSFVIRHFIISAFPLPPSPFLSTPSPADIPFLVCFNSKEGYLMPIEFKCSQCGRLLRTGDETAGRLAQCPQCGSQTQIPQPSQPPATPPADEIPTLQADDSPFGNSGNIPPLGGSPFNSQAGPNPYQSPRQTAPAHYGSDERNSHAVTSLTLGIIGLVMALCCPLIGIICSIVGLVFGVTGLRSSKRGMAIAGIICSGLGLVLGILNGILGAIMAINGQHPFVQ
jgi:hypothetical protein